MQYSGGLFPESHPILVPGAISGGYAGDVLGCAVIVVPAQDMLVIGKGIKADRVERINFQPVFSKLKLVNNLVL